MGKMLIDYGVRGKREIDVPDHATGENISPRIKELGEWVGEAIQSRQSRYDHIEYLRRAGWQLTDETKPHFDAIVSDVNRFKGRALSKESVEFYDWVDDPDVRKQLPLNTSDVIKSPVSTLGEAIARLKSGDAFSDAKELLEKYRSIGSGLFYGKVDQPFPDDLDSDHFKRLMLLSSPIDNPGPTLMIGHESNEGAPKSPPGEAKSRSANDSEKRDDLSY